MSQITDSVRNESAATVRRRASVDIEAMALNALAELTEQFSKKPDYRCLLDQLVLTVSGQFSVADVIAVVRNPEAGASPPICSGTGHFQDAAGIGLDCQQLELSEYFLADPRPCCFDREDLPDDAQRILARLKETGVQVLVPLIHGEWYWGVIGLGEKISHKPLADSELELLSTLANASAPFIANSFLITQMRGLNAWYLEILDSVRQGVFVFGEQDYTLKKVNSAGMSILRDCLPNVSDFDSVIGQPLDSVFPEYAFPGWGRRLLKTRAGTHSSFIENQVAKGPEFERIYNVRFSSIERRDERESDLVFTLDDVTAQKENEQKLFDLEKFADKGVMASSIAHELNNFLALILGGVELAQMAMARGNMDKVANSLEKLKSHVGKMERYTAGLTDYTRLEACKSIASLNSTVTDVLSFVLVQKKFTRVSISTDLEPNLPSFEMDTDQIAQLLLNVLNNAADAVAETRRPDGHIEVKTSVEGDTVLLSISDNGSGITPEVKKKLFKFHLTTKETGHGYGLVICAKIISNHRAEVDINSEPGQGTTFVFRFPLHPEA